MLNPRSKFAAVLGSRAEKSSRTGRLLAALGLATVSPEIASAARRGERQSGGQESKSDEAQDNEDDRQEKTENQQEAGHKNDSDAGAEARGTADKSEKSRKQDRNEEQSGNDEGREQNGSDSGKSRADSQRRNADSDSASRDDSSAGEDSHHGGRNGRRFEQQADQSTGDPPPDNPPADRVPDAMTVTPANPNVVVDGVPETSINDLIVQANDNVIANVSTSGGFAFARSGDVIAVTGPDGASIIQTGDVTTGTTGTSPTEPPDDGGNNSPEFVS